MIANQIIGSWDRSSVNGAHFPNPLVRRMANENVFNATVRVQDEWIRLFTNLTEFEVTRAKNTLLTNIALMLDGTTPICEDIGRQMLCYGRRIPWPELAQRIQGVHFEEMKRVLGKYIWDTCPAIASIGPTEAPPDYQYSRAKMY